MALPRLPLLHGILGAIVAAAGTLPAQARVAQTPAELTVEDFFRPHQAYRAQLNPAGTHLAMLAYEEKTDSFGLRIFEVDTKRGDGLRGTTTYDIYSFRWVGDDRIVYSLGVFNRYAYGLFSIHRDRPNKPVTLNVHDVVDVLGSPLARPNNAFVWIRNRSSTRGHSGTLMELDVRRDPRNTLKPDQLVVADRIAPPPGEGVLGWLRDRTGEIRYSVGYAKGIPYLYRRNPDGQWTLVNIDVEEYVPLAVDAEPHTLFLARPNADGMKELVRFNTVDGSMGPVIHADDKYDLGEARLVLSDGEEHILGLAYDKQGPTQIWFHEEDAALQQAIDQALPANRVNLITDRSRDGSRLLIESFSDRHAGTLYLFEPKAGALRSIAEFAPQLPEPLLGEVKLIRFKTRDGLVLDGYLTLPAGHDTGKPAPMVVLPHGGPWVRDVWGFNPEAQFLASRGYVVFQPNYRGSTGYGAAISKTSRADFLRMHEDVTDGTRMLIKSGIADPERIAIFGASFGGYLALCGAAFEPDLYRCAVTFAGVFDWEHLMREMRRGGAKSFSYDWLVRQLGDPKHAQEKFDAMSPINSAGTIKVPVFIAHGEADRVATASQSHRLARALAESGVPHETLFVDDEGHGFASMKNRVELYKRIESFLKKNL
ncbi:MAG TPA: S9 family peptidase [Opitutaceae bacterium]|nr:S9 family peptidase [Opitutaceae bacterium]